MNHPKTDELRRRWIDYVQEINKMRWNLPPNHPDHKRFVKAYTTILQIAQTIKSTGEIEEGDTVSNGNEQFVVVRVEDDRVYCDDNHFFHPKGLFIKKKFDETATEVIS